MDLSSQLMGSLSRRVSQGKHEDLRQSKGKEGLPMRGRTIDEVEKIINKHPEQRNHTDILILGDFIDSNPYLTELKEKVSQEFVRSILKCCKFETLPQNIVLYKEGRQIDKVYQVIEGKLAVLNRSKEYITEFQKSQMMNRLITKAVDLVKKIKREGFQSTRRMSIFQQKRPRSSFQNQIDYYIYPNQSCGFFDLSCEGVSIQTVLTNQPTKLLVFGKNQLMCCLEQAFREKIENLKGHIQCISCFKNLQQEKIQQIIQSLEEKKGKKGQAVFLQGDTAQNLYFLTKGEVKITKQTDLFIENPNQLYLDRVGLLEEVYHIDETMDRIQILDMERKKKKGILPYANLSSLYNYEPQTKPIQICVISPFCMFGQEQHIHDNARQTNAVCLSTNVEYYQIQMKKLKEILGGKVIPHLMDCLKKSLLKKVLYRQQHFSLALKIENKNNLNYFYYQGDKQKESSRKYKLNKINTKLGLSQRKPINQKPTVPPYFTSFNFHKLESRAKKRDYSLKQNSGRKMRESLNPQNQIQRKIMEDYSHTWKMIEQKVQQQKQKSRKISKTKHAITLKRPLIDSQYFYHVDRQKKRIEKQERKRDFWGKKSPGKQQVQEHE